MRDLAIFGIGGMGRDAHAIVEDIVSDGGKWNVVGFLDDNPAAIGTQVHELPVLGDASWICGRPTLWVVVSLGDPVARRLVVQQMRGYGQSAFATLVHPKAVVGRRVSLGSGTTVCAGTVVTTDVVSGEHVVYNMGCTIGHDSRVEDFATVAPGVHVSGNVRLGEGCNIGTGTTINQGRSVGKGAMVGAGAAVVENVPPDVTVVGVPARIIRHHVEPW